jgi:hypothetical protein
VQFGLQFGTPGAANDSARQHMAVALPDLVGHPEEPSNLNPAGEAEEADASAEPPSPAGGAEVVHLDRFRKK